MGIIKKRRRWRRGEEFAREAKFGDKRLSGSCSFTRRRDMRKIVVSSRSRSSSGEVFEGIGRDFGFGGGIDGLGAAEIRFGRWKGEGNGGGGVGGGGRVEL